MLYIHRSPIPPLDQFIRAIWFCRSDPGPRRLERVLPSAAAQLIINLKEDQTRLYTSAANGQRCDTLPGSILTGITTRPQIIDTDEQENVAGVSFRPGGTMAFFAPSAAEICDADVPLDALWGISATARLREKLLASVDPEATLDILERELCAALCTWSPHPAVVFSLSRFSAQPSMARIAAVTRAIGLSHKRFAERFRFEVGITPKKYCRLLRFQQAVAQAHAASRVDWSQLALDCGYFDQAHLVHDFRAFAGLTPNAYGALRTPFQNHVNFLQSDAG
jgi:AraC-like DNA-binding protein